MPTTANAILAFERIDEKWHMRIHRAADGTSIIERLRGPGRCKPQIWTTDHSPEGWVDQQKKPQIYRAQGTPLPMPRVKHDGDIWKIIGIGGRDHAGRVYLHLVSTTRTRMQKNGENPVYIADWVPLATLHAAYRAQQNPA